MSEEQNYNLPYAYQQQVNTDFVRQMTSHEDVIEDLKMRIQAKEFDPETMELKQIEGVSPMLPMGVAYPLLTVASVAANKNTTFSQDTDEKADRYVEEVGHTSNETIFLNWEKGIDPANWGAAILSFELTAKAGLKQAIGGFKMRQVSGQNKTISTTQMSEGKQTIKEDKVKGLWK